MDWVVEGNYRWRCALCRMDGSDVGVDAWIFNSIILIGLYCRVESVHAVFGGGFNSVFGVLIELI